MEGLIGLTFVSLLVWAIVAYVRDTYRTFTEWRALKTAGARQAAETQAAQDEAQAEQDEAQARVQADFTLLRDRAFRRKELDLRMARLPTIANEVAFNMAVRKCHSLWADVCALEAKCADRGLITHDR